jgi:hypothetical protein
MGYRRDDPSTVHPDKLPVINEKGMLLNYGAPHEDFVWDIRSEAGVVSAFEQVYDTEDLIVSFDAINYGFSNRQNLPANKPWPHQDQDPERPGFRCLQGLVNLLPNGPNDGGLIVCKGAHLLSEQFHEDMKDEERIPQWTKEWYGFTERGMAWLKDHGCEWVKVEAEPGDLLLCMFMKSQIRRLVADHAQGTHAPRITMFLQRASKIVWPFTLVSCPLQMRHKRIFSARRLRLRVRFSQNIIIL